MPMPESPPSRGRAATQPSAGSARNVGRATGAPQVQVRYYHRMRPNRVYPVVVSWKGGARAAAPVTVRLVMAGAQVVPAEQTLEPGGDGRVTFHVTPIARGWLRGERLEVLQDGRKVQEIRLPCKATTQRLTWLLLLLTIFTVWWVVPLFTDEAREPRTPTERQIIEGDPVPFDVGERALTRRVKRYLPRLLPAVEQQLPKDIASEVSRNLTKDVPEYIGASIYVLHSYEVNDHIPIVEAILGVLILLTLLSWYTHLERRKRRVGKALPVGA